MTSTQVSRGRPKKGGSASETLPPIRVTPQQKEKYRTAAKSAGLSLSAWFKKIADENIKVKNESN
jgi:hypothetical protein